MKPTTTPAARACSSAAVWAPWLAAPLFALLPIGGCGLAGSMRPAAAQPPGAASATVTAAPVVPVMPASDRQVAARSPAH